MQVHIVFNQSRYNKEIKDYQIFLADLDEFCQKITNRKIDITLYHTNPFQIQKIGKNNFKQIIKNRLTGERYTCAEEIKFPTIISLLYQDSYGEIYISIYNILRKYNISLQNSKTQIRLYLAHSICNLYELNDEIYFKIAEFIKKQDSNKIFFQELDLYITT